MEGGRRVKRECSLGNELDEAALNLFFVDVFLFPAHDSKEKLQYQWASRQHQCSQELQEADQKR